MKFQFRSALPVSLLDGRLRRGRGRYSDPGPVQTLRLAVACKPGRDTMPVLRHNLVNLDIHMHWRLRRMRRPAANEPGHAHELTFSCFHSFQFLRAERTCQWLADAVDEARRQFHFLLWAYVLMPEHVHILIWPNQEIYDIGNILKAIKQPVGTKAIKYIYLIHGVIQSEANAFEPIWDNCILKKQLIVKHAWEVGRNEPDSAGIKAEDDPVIPPDQEHAPVLELLAGKRESAEKPS